MTLWKKALSVFLWAHLCVTFAGVAQDEVRPATIMAIENKPPVARAGEDIALVDNDRDGKEEVLLDGSASTDSDGQIEHYGWWVESQVIAEGEKPTIEFNVGQTTVKLIVTDDKGDTSSDEVVVTISEPADKAPVANAGENIVVEDKNNDQSEEITLDGSASREGSAGIIKYSWTTAEEEIASGVSVTVTLPVGETKITLTVTDESGKSSRDEVIVTVLAFTNMPPVADAGPDQDLIDEDGDGEAEVTLDGSGSEDEDGIIESYLWTWEGLADSVAGIKPQIILPVGVTEVILTVKDNKGATGQDTVVISIQPKNAAPVANAGADQEVADEDGDGEAEVTLDGTASLDDDGSISNYVWYNSEEKEIATGDRVLVKLPVGVWEILLVVTDDRGAKDTASMKITVMKPLAVNDEVGEEHNIQAFPNPARERFTVSSSIYAGAVCYLINIKGEVTGKIKMINGKAAFDVSGYPAGIYYLLAEVKGKRMVRKVIIN